MTDSKTSAGHSTGVHSPLPPDKAMSWFPVLLAQVSELHRAGRLHGAIAAAGITVDANGRPVLALPADSIVLRGDAPEACPPELPSERSWNLPTHLAAARALLTASGVEVDPRRIDVYQLGVLLCSAVSRQPTSVYLRSPKARGLVPAELRPVIDRALGYDQETRIADCDQLTALVIEAANPPVPRHAETPAQGVAQSPDTPPPAKTEPRPSGTKPPKSPASASAINLPFSRLGAYEIIDRIGGGGMGDVYKAHDESLDRIVAIKVLPAELARQADFVRRFRAEAMAIAKLMHPNIVQVFAFGEDAGRHFFAMQFVDGESLAQVLRRRSRLRVEEALPIFQQCLSGLAAAHERGLIHRDIKPGNILIDHQHRRALVADFGLVKTADSGENLTATGVIMGTVDYISPEQARGQNVDGRSDLYSLGALMYQVLAGRLPFISDSATGMIFQHAFEKPKELCEVAPEVPEQVGAIVMRLLAKIPAERYATAKEVSAAIQAFRAGKQPAGVASSELKPRVAGVGGSAAGGASVIGLPPLLAAPRAANWADRLRDLWRAHAPAAIQGPQNTQQQVDGAVEEYERRRNELSALARDAAAVAADFAAQAASHRKAAAAAAKRAEKVSDSLAAEKAREEQVKCEQVANDFESQLAEQQEQSEAIQLRLTQVNATLQKLRSQRDVLQARLRAANARLAAEGGRPARRNLAGLFAGGLAVGLLVVLLGTWIIVRDRKGSEVAKIEVPEGTAVEVKNFDDVRREPVSPAAIIGPSPASDADRAAAEWVIAAGGNVSVGNSSSKIAAVGGLPSGDFRLQSIDLHGTSIRDAEMDHLKNLLNLKRLELMNTPISDVGLTCLRNHDSLTFIDLGNTRITDAGLENLSGLPNVTTLGLLATQTTDAGLEPVCKLLTLTSLNLDHTKIGNAGLRRLKPLKQLGFLNLDSTAVNDQGIAHLAELENLRALILGKTELTDVGLTNLAGLKYLRDLNIKGTKVTIQGVDKLQAALPSCKITWDGLNKPMTPTPRVGPVAAYPSGPGGLVCARLAAKAGATALVAAAQAFDGPRSGGRSGSKGILLQAPRDWRDTGTAWRFDYHRNADTAYTLQIIHPFKQGQVLISMWKDVAITTSGNWDEVGWTDPASMVPLEILPELSKRLPMKTAQNAPVQITSRLDADGNYQMELNGQIVVRAKIANALPLNLSIRANHRASEVKDDGKPPFSGAELPRTLVAGEAALLLSPQDQGEHWLTNVFLEGPNAPMLRGRAPHAGLIGRLTYQDKEAGIPEEQDARLIVQYAAGRSLPWESILTPLKNVYPGATPKTRTVVALHGTLRVPNNMNVGIRHKGGSSNGGVHYLLVDDRELGAVGDDRTKDSFYSINLPAGDHPVTWRLTGGDMGGINVIEFVERKTGRPLELFTTDKDIAAANSGPTAVTIDNFSFASEPFAPPSENLDVAEWAMSVGGKLQVKARNDLRQINTAADLPSEYLPPEFEVVDLDLAGRNITDADLSRLVRLSQLERLNLQGTPITDTGLRHIEKLAKSKLAELDLRSTAVTAAGVAALQKAMPKCKIESDEPGTLTMPAPVIGPATSANLLPGLLVTEYPRQPSQDSNHGAFVPLDQFGDPLGRPSVVASLTDWRYKEPRNAMAEGLLKIDVAGEYQFRSNSYYDRNALYINGGEVCRYTDGEKTISKVNLKPGLIPIASLGYVAARGTVTVQWAPPGQPEMSDIPRELLFHPADLMAKRAAEVENAEQKRQALAAQAQQVDVGNFEPGLLELRYARLASQPVQHDHSTSLSPAELGEPLAPPTLVQDVAPWRTDRKENYIAFGYLRVDRDGEYGFRYMCGFNRCRLYIDGQLLFKSEEEDCLHRIRLKAGMVPCILVSNVQNPKMTVQWQPPGQVEVDSIPREVLFHDPAITRPPFPKTVDAPSAIR